MAMELPASPKVYTTTYDNFKGVDYTNDSTNVWRRRSPTGYNMLPDASGRPFKRHGWEVMLSHEQIAEIIGVDEFIINKLAYFELAGVDHIVVFTDGGVFFYNGEVTYVSNDPDLCNAYDRNFFFEGGGTSAFYVYSNSAVWRYDDDFTLKDVTHEAYVPTVLVGTSADGTGTLLEGYNLVGNRAAVTYNDKALFAYWCSDGIAITVTQEANLKTALSNSAYKCATWVYDGSSWTDTTSSLTLGSYISVTGTPKEGDAIVAINGYGVVLPNNVAQTQITTDVEAYGSTTTSLDTPLTVRSAKQTLATKECSLYTDPTGKRSWVIFYDNWVEKVQGEDFIKVVFPINTITTVTYALDQAGTIDESAASLVERG